jgi:NAD+-dependent protein deacetylase sirtuin 4
LEERPADPSTLIASKQDLQQHVDTLADWFDSVAEITARQEDGMMRPRKQILCLTGAGLSTEAGIPDYRGHNGAYHDGHQPMRHDQFVASAAQRQRYWGRSMVGWRFFHERQPALGHVALAKLEQLGLLGVSFPDPSPSSSSESHAPKSTSRLSIVTQNVDSLHRRGGSRHVLELHGRGDRVVCLNCGHGRDRHSFQLELQTVNADWLSSVLDSTTTTTTSTKSTAAHGSSNSMRPDGDADMATTDYSGLHIPNCEQCGTGVFKPDVVFFGDSVPTHRVQQCQAAIEACGELGGGGLLVVGTSLAVHSAFRHVRAAHARGIPIAILNVGTTRAEREGLNVLKIEAPAGPTLDGLVQRIQASSGTL